MSLHSSLSPSASARWVRCTGSLHLAKKYPAMTSKSSALERGVQLHEVAKLYFTTPSPMGLAYQFKARGKYEESELINYYHYALGIKNKLTSSKIYVEERVDIKRVHDDMYGTPDVVIIGDDTLHIIDLKTGRQPVSSEYNTQLMLYAQGAIDTYKITPDTISLHIYQPHTELGSNINVTTLTYNQLQHFIESVKSLLDMYDQGILKYATGDHCQYCPVSYACPKRLSYNLDLFTSLVGKEYSIEGLHTPEEAISIVSKYKELAPFIQTLETKLSHLSDEVLEENGVTRRNRRLPEKYADEEKALSLLQEIDPDQDRYAPRSLLSPSKLKKYEPELYDKVSNYISPPEVTTYLIYKKS